eukprot:tig00000241_g21059.t1
MADDLEYYDSELSALVADCEKDLAKLQKQKGARRSETIDGLKEKMARMKDNLKSLNIEVRDLPKNEKQLKYKKKATEYDQKIKEFQNQLQWAKSSDEKSQLMSGAAATKKPVGEKQKAAMRAAEEKAMEEADPDTLDGKQLIQVAERTQEKSKKSITNMKRLVAEAETVGAATNVKLQEQTDQMRRIGEGLDQVESNLKRAEKQIRVIARGIARDKIAWVFLVLILGAIGFIIYWKVAKKGGSDQILGLDALSSQVCKNLIAQGATSLPASCRSAPTPLPSASSSSTSSSSTSSSTPVQVQPATTRALSHFRLRGY